ncbi:hypothetical protein PPL_07654 [Heterostelium album PN500]|uniref:Uncharacterized protein n=1 Tax=Heterostelium pallidum (strain ATCC 26659 / Pp 5 / PN500) TaxID=670386 RepID=D3BGK2_HETP5|nr:hypothetical protein PPL_07654 [Heterostelium album PN500]EFA79236.1 hypothetical protein PPL_07654 [Heterostelium album PN500]|eukprot:XP_020431357.1 hypothetical protein PPL_07654 [Heterostelium album PN500]
MKDYFQEEIQQKQEQEEEEKVNTKDKKWFKSIFHFKSKVISRTTTIIRSTTVVLLWEAMQISVKVDRIDYFKYFVEELSQNMEDILPDV